MHKPPFQTRTRLPVRERLRLTQLARKRMRPLWSALLCAPPLLYLLGEVLFAQP